MMKCTAILLAGAVGFGGLGAAAAGPLRVGVAVEDITPPVGFRMSGYFRERLSTGTADPLKAKALVLRQGPVAAAMVFCDIIGISPAVSAGARLAIAERTGIPPANVLIAATHSHTGPLYWGALRDHFHDRAVAKHGRDPSEPVDYPRLLVERIARAVARADAAAGAVAVSAGAAKQEGLSFNRRFHMKDGTVRFNPGVRNPNIVRPAGPIDPQVGIVLFRAAAGGGVRAALVNFALHLDTVGGTRYSADYPAHLERALRERLDESLVLLFATGACGDINHIDVTRRERPTAGQIGSALARTVAAAVPKLRAVERPALAVRRTVVEAALQQVAPAELARARADIAKVGTRELGFLDQVRAYRTLAVAARGGRTIPLEVQAFRLGDDLAVVGLPGEVFVELGLAVRRASPFATTLVVELCHDAPGYIPTKKAFAEGSYETVNSRIAPGEGERLVAAAGRLLRQLAAGGAKEGPAQ